MRRLLYCLLGSTLFHSVLLWVPFPMSAGGAGENALQAVRVRLVDPPRSEARVSEPTGPPRRAVKSQQAKAEKPRPMTKRPQAASRPRTQVVKALAEAPSPVPSEPTRSRTVGEEVDAPGPARAGETHKARSGSKGRGQPPPHRPACPGKGAARPGRCRRGE